MQHTAAPVDWGARLITAVRYAVRLLSMLWLGLVAFIFVMTFGTLIVSGEFGRWWPPTPEPRDYVLFGGEIVLMLGLLLAFRWERLGGLLVVSGITIFQGWLWREGRRGGQYDWMSFGLAGLGLLYLLLGSLPRRPGTHLGGRAAVAPEHHSTTNHAAATQV
jgi:hypothetical protein